MRPGAQHTIRPKAQPGDTQPRDSFARRASARARVPAVCVLTAVLAAALALPAAAPAAVPGSSLPAIESQVMCVTCKIPLNVAESSQADRERAFIRELLAQGQSEAQVKRALVAQYGPQVLALPSTHGFDLAAYLVPIAAFALVLGALALLLPRWRRRANSSEGESGAPRASGEAGMSPADTARLEADLAQFD
jgi:cytochrome c-type biogenesis protein CcmH